MLHNLTKGWYLCCHKHERRNLNAYPNIYSRESIFLFKGNSTIRFNYTPNKQIKQFFRTDILNKTVTLMQITKNLVLQVHCGRGT